MGQAKNKQLELEDYLRDSDSFDEFLSKADNTIAARLAEISGGKEPLWDDVVEYARQGWDEWATSSIPF